MILSRLVPVFSTVVRSARGGSHGPQKMFSTSSALNSGAPYVYREANPPNKNHVLYAEICGAFMWWWIYWHLFTDYGHLIGHQEYPSERSWTDEELGIPPDDAEDPDVTLVKPKQERPSVLKFKLVKFDYDVGKNHYWPSDYDED